MLATSFALMSNELGVSAFTTNTILAIAGLLVLGLPLLFVVRAQNKDSSSAFSLSSTSKDFSAEVAVETSPQIANEADKD